MAARFFARRTRKEASTLAQSEEPMLKHTFEGHEDSIWDFVFLHDNVHIVSGSLDGTMRKWNCDTGLLVGELWRGHGGRIYALALSPDGKTIACGRGDGSVQRWNTNGKMIAGVWTCQSNRVRALSWSPSGDYLASGFYDGTILIRKAENGKVEVGPIKTKQIHVCALAYSPSGDRIASGGDKTVCIWDTKTGKRVVGPIKGLGHYATSLVWSSDSTKLYSASDQFARVFDTKSGEQLHSIEHDHFLYSVALSPKHNVLACVGSGTAKLWDTESLQPLGQPLNQDRKRLDHVSFSPDGHHLAYSGNDKKLTLWSVKDIAPQLAAPILLQQRDRQSIQQDTRPDSPSSSCLDADATGGSGIIEERYDDPYHNFFQSSPQSLSSPTPGSHLHQLFSGLLKVLSPYRPPADESVRKERSKRKFFARRARSNPSLELAAMKPNQPVQEGKVREGKGAQGDNDRGSANHPLSARKNKGKQRDKPLMDTQSPPSDDPTHPDDFNSNDNRNLWKRMMRAPGKDPSDTTIAPTMKRPEVVEVSAVRGFQGYVAMKRVRKTKSLAVTSGVPPTAACTSASSSQPVSSSQAVPVQAGPSSHAVVANGAQPSQASGGPSSHASPSHFVTNYHTNHYSDSRSSIEGSCNRFLDRICFPRGHYHDDS